MRRIALGVLFSFLTVHILFAQDVDCTALNQKIIEASRQACPTVGLNQACYGSSSSTLEIEPRDNVRVAFSKPGDMVSLAALKSLTSSPFSPEDENGGVALIHIGGNFPGTDATLLAFGEVHLENLSNAGDDFAVLDAKIGSTGANVREKPSADSTLIRTQLAGDTVPIIGRLADNSWLRLPDGWLSADTLQLSGDFTQLPILEADSTASDFYGPMQTFRLHTGQGDSPCSGLPDSGLLIQLQDNSSQRAGLLNINGVGLDYTGTLWLRTTEDGKTILSVLEGSANYTEVLWQTGDSVTFGYQGDTLSFEKPDDYNYALAHFLPLQLLPREFELPFSLGGVIFPFVPGTGFLNGIAADAACTVAWGVDVNIRSGPGTNYPLRRGVSSGFYGHPDARAVGTDGAVWWRLLDGIWVAANNTAAAGACGNLPLVKPPPLPAKP